MTKDESLTWAIRQLHALVHVSGYGAAYIRGTGTELAGFAQKIPGRQSNAGYTTTAKNSELAAVAPVSGNGTEPPELDWKKCGIVELAVRNPNVASYIEHWEGRTQAAEAALETAKKDAESWKHHWQMYRDAWVRELGGWTIPKSHEIDSLVLTTRKRCVNPLLGNCNTPHWLGKPTEDRKALQQTPHPRDSSCKDWKADDSEAGAASHNGQGWIRVEDRLPETFEQVLVNLKPVPDGPDWYPRTNRVLAWQKRGIWFGTFIEPLTGVPQSGEFPDDLITHWQPLPAPPSEANGPQVEFVHLPKSDWPEHIRKAFKEANGSEICNADPLNKQESHDE